MSRAGREWAYQVKGLGTQYGVKVVLWYLGDMHNKREGVAYPSVAIMSQALEMPERTVKHAIKVLEQSSLISILQKGNQYQRTEYKLHFNHVHAVKVQNPAQKQVQNPASEGATNVSEGAKPCMPIKERTGKNRERTKIETGTKKKKRTPRITVIDDLFREKMHDRFDKVLGDINERIDEALGHKAALKYNDLQAYVQGWLRRDAEKQQPNPNGVKPGIRSPDGIDYSAEKYEEMARKFNT